MTLEDRYKSLDIDREAITKACADPPSTSVSKEPHYFTKTIGERIKPPIEEDLSRFVSKMGQKMALNRRKQQPTTKPK